ncbi:MAG: PEP-CTERM sorting domain-containing protein [Bryobacteraceae bacterium]|jgi:hypothetical protein
MRPFSIGLVLIAISFLTRASTVVFDQSPPNDNATDFVNFRLADDFALSSATLVDGIDFWYSAQNQSDLSSVTYAIYSNSAGSLGSLLFTGTLTPATSYDSIDNTFFAALTVPDLSLASGTYWLELHGGASLTDDNGTITVWWDSAADNATYMALQGPDTSALPNQPITFSGSEQQAFQIDGTLVSATVPEPSSVLLAACGLSALIFKRKSGTSNRATIN